jgi:hypothetical protein
MKTPVSILIAMALMSGSQALSVKQIMQTMVDPAADAIWDSVGTLITAKGVIHHQPQTEAEWQQMRRHALTLISATNLLSTRARTLVPPGGKVADEGSVGVLTAAQGQKLLDERHEEFAQFARALHDVSEQMLRAIDARDPKAMLDVGGTMDDVCEGCHRTFWYPG